MIAVYLAMLETDVDRDKFMKLYESYEKKLFAVALRILENNEKAEDAVQQAWLRIILIEVDGKTVVELDKLNEVYKVKT